MADWQRDLRGGATRPRATSAPRPSGAVHHREVEERDARIAELRAELAAARDARAATPSPRRTAASPADDAARQVLLELRSRIAAVEESEAAEAGAAVEARLSEARAVEEARVSQELAAEARVADTTRSGKLLTNDTGEVLRVDTGTSSTGARAESMQEARAPHLCAAAKVGDFSSPRTPEVNGEAPQRRPR